MVNQQIVDWIKNQESKGYSEEQLKQYLLNQGYNQTDIVKAINLSKEKSKIGFNQFLSQKGTLFKVLFYFLTIFFSLQLITEIIFLLIQLRFITLIIPLIFGSLLILVIHKRNLNGVLMTIFLLSPIGLSTLAVFPLLQSFMAFGNLLSYVLISIYTLVTGLIIAYMFNKVCLNFKKYLISGIVFSSILGFVFAINNVIVTTLLTLYEQMSQLSANNIQGQFKILTIFNPNFINTNIAFILAILFFNIPYAIFYFKRENKKIKLFLLYLIPITIFILLSYILKEIVNNILTGMM